MDDPPADVYTTSTQVVISVELPGVLEDAVHVDAQDGAITVHGRREARTGTYDFHRLERACGEFRCQIALPRGADAARRRVTLSAGVLTVEIPRTTP
jgi:HSP20 family protein